MDSRLFGGTDVLQPCYNQSDVLGTRLDITTPIPLYGKPEIVGAWTSPANMAPSRRRSTISPSSTGPVDGYSARTARWPRPPRVFNSTAVFAQGEWTPLAALVLRGGVRHERVKVTSSDFTDSTTFLPASSIEFDTTGVQCGIVYHLLDPLDVFFNFSQGFNVPVGSIDNATSNVPPGTAISLQRLQPQRVNNYELGLREKWNKVQASVSGYISKSSLV